MSSARVADQQSKRISADSDFASLDAAGIRRSREPLSRSHYQSSQFTMTNWNSRQFKFVIVSMVFSFREPP